MKLLETVNNVVGNPNLSQVKTIMIGIRNPKKILTVMMMDYQSAVKYVNELRLTDFDGMVAGQLIQD